MTRLTVALFALALFATPFAAEAQVGTVPQRIGLLEVPDGKPGD